MNTAGVPPEGYKSVGDIVATHTLQFDSQVDGESIAMEILTNHIAVVPVVDTDGYLEGVVGELEILKALQEGKDLTQMKAKDLMKKEKPIHVTDSTPISDALKILQSEHMPIVPVVEDERVIKSITRHDLIRAMSGAGLGVETH
ncbi:CBS domain-containing protein [Candidatus Nitronereus thalassa]|uniref:CBS domain-containing protein n=1 Tax=Candidatus Nitronereus thalassa TaxID=3020898 RepID=A0ABU3KBX8_9BACT|nr:CBS domain-containing protein [Candidatus Nitronereus thalassa]MDT7043734.1 CBS domain-containing protein [Candidatus Nitronereus thalassa]